MSADPIFYLFSTLTTLNSTKGIKINLSFFIQGLYTNSPIYNVNNNLIVNNNVNNCLQLRVINLGKNKYQLNSIKSAI